MVIEIERILFQWIPSNHESHLDFRVIKFWWFIVLYIRQRRFLAISRNGGLEPLGLKVLRRHLHHMCENWEVLTSENAIRSNPFRMENGHRRFWKQLHRKSSPLRKTKQKRRPKNLIDKYVTTIAALPSEQRTAVKRYTNISCCFNRNRSSCSRSTNSVAISRVYIIVSVRVLWTGWSVFWAGSLCTPKRELSRVCVCVRCVCVCVPCTLDGIRGPTQE